MAGGRGPRLGDALLNGDLLEARFLAARVLEAAKTNKQTAVAEAAFEVLQRLTPAQGPPGEGVGRAFRSFTPSSRPCMPGQAGINDGFVGRCP